MLVLCGSFVWGLLLSPPQPLPALSCLKPDSGFLKCICYLKNKEHVVGDGSSARECLRDLQAYSVQFCFAFLKLILSAVCPEWAIIPGLQHAHQLPVGKKNVLSPRHELVFHFMKGMVWLSTPCPDRNGSWGFLSRAHLSNSGVSKNFYSSLM